KNSSSFGEKCDRHEPEGQKKLLPREPEDITDHAASSPEHGPRGEAPSSAQAGGGRSNFGNEREEDDTTTRLQDQRVHRLSGPRRGPDPLDRGAGGRRRAA